MTNTILDSRTEISALDKSNMLGSIESLADQVRHAWESVKLLDMHVTGEIANVVVSGMGGSALGPDVIKHLFKDKLQVPFEIVNSYHLPAYVSEKTLIILSSYSGTTEETLSCAEEAINSGAQIMVICSGGPLADIARDHNYPLYQIDPKHNPSNQPRMAIGYSIFGIMSMLAQAGLLPITQEEVDEVITTIIATIEQNTVEVAAADNQAKKLAYTIVGRRPVFFAADFLQGAVHVATNQHNENGKIFADYKIIPETNHHAMEGLPFPETISATHAFVFFQSDLYEQPIQRRVELTQEVAQRQSIDSAQVQLSAETKLTQVFELIALMSFTGFYIAMIEGIDPSPIPIVDWFKAQLKK